jgi:hypothetical protein
MLICPETSNAQNNIAAVSADGSTVCVFDQSLELLAGRGGASLWSPISNLRDGDGGDRFDFA